MFERSNKMTLSKSEMDGLLALAAKSQLLGGRSTDAKAGTIHAPTAARLVAKGLAVGPDGSKRYAMTKAGRAELPGAETLSAIKTPEPSYPDREPTLLVAAKAIGTLVMVHVGDKPTPKAKPESKSPSNVVAPPIVTAELARRSEPPPLLREPEPAAKLIKTVVCEEGFRALHQTGSIVVQLPDGRARINAVGSGGNFEFWIKRNDSVGWARLPLGNAMTLLDGAKVLDTTPMPGKLPFRPIPMEERA
jgi:hypothetical protein